MYSFANTVLVLMTVVALLFTPIQAHAQDEADDVVETYRLPAGVPHDIDGTWYRCYDLVDYRALLEMDVNLRAADRLIPNLQAQVERLTYTSAVIQRALDAAMETQEQLQAERSRLLARWTEENRLRLELESRPQFGSIAAWVIVAAEAVALAILGGVLAAEVAND